MSNDDTGIIFQEGFLQIKAFGQTRWQRRYCIIDWDKAMFFVALKNDRHQGDYIKLLPKVIISDSEIATDLTIEIIDDNKRSHFLLPESKKEHTAWLIALKRTAYSRFGGGIFGQSLDDTYRYAIDKTSLVPVIVRQCCEFLLEYGTTFVGLFRVPGKQSLIRELRDKYDRCQSVELNNAYSPATLASLLKIYLQSLPEPIIPMKHFDDFLEIGTRFKYNQTSDLDNLKQHVKISLSKTNYALLAYLCLFLRKLTEYSQETKMDTENLAIAFGSNIIRASEELDMNMIKGHSYNLIPLIKALIDHSEYLFSNSGDELCEEQIESGEKTDESIRKSSGFSSFSSLLSSNHDPHANLGRTRSSSLPSIPFFDSAHFSFDGRSDNSSTQSSFDKSQDHSSFQSNSPQSSTTYIQGEGLINEEIDDTEVQLTNSAPVEVRDTITRDPISKEKRRSAMSWQFGLKSNSFLSMGKTGTKSFADKVGKSITTLKTSVSKAFIPHDSSSQAHTIDTSSLRADQRRTVDTNTTENYLKVLQEEICVLKGIIGKKETMIIQLRKTSDEERLQYQQENSQLKQQIERLQWENSQLKAFYQADN